MTPAPIPRTFVDLRGTPDRSFLLRIRVLADGTRYLVQDLKTSERHEFAGAAELQRFLAGCAAPGLR
ncbi:MAG: hypothetical protein JNL30_04815 [Rubrivivax sp.]|nr:hypothetical protein [Rubrivivax sp.]